MALSKITNLSVADTIISGQTALGAAPADTDEFLVSDAGVLKRVDYSYIKPTAQVFRRDANPLIINGDMGVAQRETSVTGKTNGDSGYYTVDRIQFAESGTMTAVITNTQESLSYGMCMALLEHANKQAAEIILADSQTRETLSLSCVTSISSFLSNNLLHEDADSTSRNRQTGISYYT